VQSLTQCQSLLAENNVLKNQNEGQVAALQLEIVSLKSAKDEVSYCVNIK